MLGAVCAVSTFLYNQSAMKKNIVLFFLACLLHPLLAEALSYNNPDLIFPRANLQAMTIHMLKILPTKTGSAPVVEVRFDKKYKWMSSSPSLCGTRTWGKVGSTYKYEEEMVQGSHVAFGNYNHIYDVSYYKCEGAHPVSIATYNNELEQQKLKRFVFFRFTATAAKNSRFFEKKLDNYMVALDVNTKLLFSYGAPSDYEGIIGGNYIPLKWLPYEIHPNTSSSNLKFYQYDPIGYVLQKWSENQDGIVTNVVLYDWWAQSVRAGNSLKSVKAKRFMPRVAQDARVDYMVRNPSVPIASPYRNGMQL